MDIEEEISSKTVLSTKTKSVEEAYGWDDTEKSQDYTDNVTYHDTGKKKSKFLEKKVLQDISRLRKNLKHVLKCLEMS